MRINFNITFKYMLLLCFCVLLCGCSKWLRIMEAEDPFEIRNVYAEKSLLGALFGTDVIAMGTIATAANRRLSLVKLNRNGSYKDAQFCSEPPPDVASEITSKFTAALAIKLKETTATAKVIDNYLAKVVKLAARSERVEIYRSGLFALCQYGLNHKLTPNDIKTMFEHLTSEIVKIKVSDEIVKIKVSDKSKQPR